MGLNKIFIFIVIILSLVLIVFLAKNSSLLEKTAPELKEQLEQTKQAYKQVKKIVKDSPLQELTVLSKLTLEQKIGQLVIVGIDKTTITSSTQALFNTFYPGGVLLLKKNIESPKQLKKLTENLQKLSLETTKLPLFISVDQEGGPISRLEFLKEKTAQSEILTSAQARQVGWQRGKELKGLGINLNFSPVLDITKKTDFIFNRTFQRGADSAAELARGLIEGQKQAGIFSCLKHFPGYSNIPFHPEDNLASVAKAPEFSQFQKAMPAEPEFVMTANVIYRNLDERLPFTFASSSIQLLKQELDEQAIIISDDLSQHSLFRNFSLKEIMTLPLKAGVDMLIFSGWRSPVAEAMLTLQEAAKAGEVSEEKINQALLKILKLKKKL